MATLSERATLRECRGRSHGRRSGGTARRARITFTEDAGRAGDLTAMARLNLAADWGESGDTAENPATARSALLTEHPGLATARLRGYHRRAVLWPPAAG
jgi:hypothetical protein